jgi:DNA (cytosine-5)-methyltransferase 1
LVPPGGNWRDIARQNPELLADCWRKKWENNESGTSDVMGRMVSTKQSLTIRNDFFKPEKGSYLHPTQHRPITPREGARLQGFPDSFKFVTATIGFPVGEKRCSPHEQICSMIGNAVPPPLARAIAGSVHSLFKK